MVERGKFGGKLSHGLPSSRAAIRRNHAGPKWGSAVATGQIANDDRLP